MDSYYLDGGALVADPNNSNVYWSGGVLGGMQVSKTTNAGVSWIRYSLNASGYTYALAVDPANSNVVYAGGNPGIYRTTNGGGAWTYCSTGLAGFVYDLAIDGTSTNVLYAATPNGLYKTTNSGANWFTTGSSNVNAVVVDPDDPNTVYIGTESGVYKSTTGGGSWMVMNDGLEDPGITSLGIYPGIYLYCGTNHAGMYRWELNVGVTETGYQEPAINLVAIPNPLRGTAVLYFATPVRSHVSLIIYDVAGRMVRTLIEQTMAQGDHSIAWDGKDDHGFPVPGGVYFSRLAFGEQRTVCQMIVLE